MKRLAGSDAGFLFIESPTQTSICVDVIEVGLPTDGRGPLQLHELRRHIESRLHRVEPFRWRLERVPLGVALPVWIDDPDFDLDYHLREVTVDAPGADADLDRVVAGQLGGLLDLRHPLWQIVLVHGLAGGRQALLFRVHHATADGEALISIINALFDDDHSPPPAPSTERPEPPSRSSLLLGGLRAEGKAVVEMAPLFVQTVRRFRSVEARRKVATVAVPGSTNDAPPTILNNSSSAERTYARTRLGLADLRRVRQTATATIPDVTLSDVILAVVSGALRRYLLNAHALPDRSLVVNVPTAPDFDGATERVAGNRFTNYLALLATDLEDPCDRLAAISAATQESKLQLDLLGTDTIRSWLDRIPPVVAEPAARAMARRSRDATEPDFNVLVSNMRVPENSWSIGTRPITRLTTSGPIADGAGLNITLTGWDPFLDVAINANPSAVERPQELAALFQGSLAELVRAYALEPAVPAPRAEHAEQGAGAGAAGDTDDGRLPPTIRLVPDPPSTGAVTGASTER